jgi:hypothetical protein
MRKRTLRHNPEFHSKTQNQKLMFKKLMLITGVAVLGLATVHAQNINPVTQTNAVVSTNGAAAANSLLDDLKHVGSDAFSALKDLNFDNGVVVEPFAMMHKSDFGGGLAVTTGNTNGLNAGFALAAINDSASKRFDFYDATLSISYGGTVTIPVIKIPAYLYAETGPALNLAHPNKVLIQSIAGAKFYFDKGKLSIGGGIGQNSEWSDPFYIVHFSYKF